MVERSELLLLGNLCVLVVGEAVVWIWGCSLTLSTAPGRWQTPLHSRAVVGGIWQSPATALSGCLWTCPCVLVAQLLPEILSRLPLCGFPGRNSHGCNKPSFCCYSMCCWIQLMAYKCLQRASIVQVGTAKPELCSFSFSWHTGRWAWVVCAVLLMVDLALAPRSSPCSSLCWVPFNLISTSLSFLGKMRACVALLPVCVGSLTSQVGQMTRFFPRWEHLVWALCSACYQVSQNAWHSYLSHFSSSFRLGLLNEFKSYYQGTDAAKILELQNLTKSKDVVINLNITKPYLTKGNGEVVNKFNFVNWSRSHVSLDPGQSSIWSLSWFLSCALQTYHLFF